MAAVCILVLISVLSPKLVVGLPTSRELAEPQVNDLVSRSGLNDSNKDMYVIHAMVYQVGIITNKTDEELDNTTTGVGNQEAVTFYHTNGSNIDLSSIPDALMTNVTAQRIVGVAPVDAQPLPWAQLNKLASSNTPELRQSRATSTTDKEYDDPDTERDDGYVDSQQYLGRLYKRSLEDREGKPPTSPVKIVSGAAVIPQEANVQSLALPPLLTLNNNFTEIPVPIPNTSIVHYAKINTVVHSTP